LVKDTQDEFDVTRSLSLNCTYACLIFIAILILNIIQMCVSFKKYTIKDTHAQSNYTPNGNVKVIPTKPITINNIGYEENIATTRSNIILVKGKEKKYEAALRKVLPKDVFSHLDELIKKGELMKAKLVKFLFDMQFEGLTEIKVIQSKITDIFARLIYLLKNTKD